MGAATVKDIYAYAGSVADPVCYYTYGYYNDDGFCILLFCFACSYFALR